MNKRILRTVSVLLAVLLILPQIMFSASALSFNGTASPGGDGSSAVTSTGGYAIPSNLTQNTNRAVGYRFTVIDGSGNAKKACVDMFRYNTYVAYNSFYAGYSKFNSKFPKTYYRTNYTSGTYTTSTTTANCNHDSNLGLTLPEDTTGIKAWCTNANMSVVLSGIWGITVSTLEQNAWAVLIEPIFALKIENVLHVMTVTEIGVYGTAKFGSGSNGGSSSNSNTWGFISNYTNKHMPNSLRLTSAYAGIPAAAQTSSRLTFGTMVTSGYGAAVVYGEYLEQSPEIIRWTYHQSSYDGFYVYVYALKAARVRVPTWTTLNGQDDLIWYDATAQTNTVNGSTYNYVVYIPKSKHNNELGHYTTHFYAYSAGGKYVAAGGGYQPPTVSAYTVTQKGSEGFFVYTNTASSERLVATVWTEKGGQDDIDEYYPDQENTTVAGITYGWKFFVPFSNHLGELGLYNIYFYVGNTYSENLLGATTTFTPDQMWDLRAEEVRVYDNNHNICFGSSVGPTFEDFYVNYMYPQCWYSTSFSVYFPAGEDNNYVRHSVWVEGLEEYASVSNEYSWDTVWIDVDVTPFDIDTNTESYIVCAKVDLLDYEGRVMQEGEVYKFYIPIQPTVIGNSVTAESITGEVAAHAGLYETTGQLYVGQRVYPKYEFICYNNFSSQHHFYSHLYEYVNDEEISASLKYENQFYDLISENTTISKDSPVSGQGILCPYTVVGDEGGRLRFELYTNWVKDINAYTDNLMFFMPIVKADVELIDIKLVDSEGYVVDTNNLMPGQELTVRYYYGNNTEVTVYVNGYNDDESMINGIFAIPPGEVISVEGDTITVPDEDFSVWGGVYFEGAGIFNTEYERDGDNNEMFLDCKVVVPLRIVPISQPIPYKESIRVVTSYWVYNDSSMYVTPSENVSVDFKVYLGDTDKVLYQTGKDKIVVPIYEKNLVYFMWKVPNGIYPQKVRIAVTLKMNGEVTDEVSLKYSVQKFPDYSAPDTVFEESAPDGFAVPSPPVPLNDYATWWEWEYLDDMEMYTKRSYGIGINAAIKEKLERVDPNVSSNPDTIKSGYAFTYSSPDKFVSVSGYIMAPSSTYTGLQYSAMLYPEYGYKHSAGFCDVLTKLNNKWQFKNNAKYGRKHFIPIYFPDTKYVTAIVRGDCWTPAGALGTTVLSEPLSVKGNAYEDWHLQHR